MKRAILLIILANVFVIHYGQVIADHTKVDKFQDIPQQYIDEVKKMWLVVAGESHSAGYRAGLEVLETLYPAYAVSVKESGTPEAYTTSHLRASRATWGDIDHSSGWIYSYGEEDWCCFYDYPTYTYNPVAVARTKAGITYSNTHSLNISAIGFGHCYDDGENLYQSYLRATQEYVDYCSTNGYSTKVFFTTGPIDDYMSSGAAGYEQYLKWEHIRDYIKDHPANIFFDYADILSYNDDGQQETASWDGHTYPVIHPDNLEGDYTGGHIGTVGALRLAKATWWMLARIAGWDGGETTTIPITAISVSGTGGATTITSDKGTLQLSAVITPSNATDKTVTWSIENGTGQATISDSGLVTAISNGTVTAKATANDGSGVFGTLTLTISNQIIQYLYVPVDSIFRTEVPVSSSHFTPYELGTEFQVLSDGYITKARLYSHVNEGGDHIVRLWELNGTTYTLAAGPFTWNFSPGLHGWRTYTLPSPVAVEANHTYIISISNSADRYFVISNNFSPSQHGAYLRYQRGVYTPTLGTVPKSTVNSCYFRDVVFAISGADTLTPGAIGTSQTICNNTAPVALTEITSPAGGTGSYAYQWQSSPDSTEWTDIPGATLSGYAPPALIANTYYRRGVMSGSLESVYSDPVLISISPLITLAQIYDNDTIDENTSTNLHVDITGSTAPYVINYTRNGVSQSAISNYASGTNISTGILTAGSYNYSLTSVTDAGGCPAQNLGTGITLEVIQYVRVPVDSIFRTEVPVSSSHFTPYELGTEFQVLSDGYITKARLYSHVNEGGDHIVRLWELNGTTYTLAAGPFTWNFSPGLHGWRTYTLPSPVAVEANHTYIISISNSADRYFVISNNFSPSQHGAYLRYQRGVYTPTLGTVPKSTVNSCYFRDVVFAISGADTLTPGAIGTSQTICYNTAPVALTEITSPAGGTGSYAYQWQSSPDSTEWTDIPGATLSGYAPPALIANTYYRRGVMSGSLESVYSDPVLISISPLITLAQIYDNDTIDENTSTNLHVDITGSTAPYVINYTRNGVSQSAISNYASGTNISTGILTAGSYNYSLTSVTDAGGCPAQNLGTGITLEVIQYVRVPVDSIFRTEVPVSSSHFTPYELGTEFQVLSDGYITKARLYSHVNEGGDHIVRLWELNGTTYTLAAGPFTWNFSPGLHGWRTYTLPSPVAVEANHTYIISISNSADRYFVISNNFSPSQHGAYLRYQRGVYTPTLGTVPKSTVNSCYFRDVVFAISGADTLTPGAIGTSQTICYNTAPVALTEITSPAGGTGSYAYQWQSSPDSTEWTDIPGATLSGYAPPALIANTYYRRGVMCGSLESVYSDPVLISISPLITLAQIYDNDTIDENTSTNLHVDITGSTAPYVINYTRNGVSQSAISNYASGTNISTGILTAGSYNYSLTSVTDAGGCPAQNLGTGITLEVIQYVRVPVDSIFRTEVPVSSSHFTPYELGTEFQVLSDGYITKARLYSHVNEGGDHIVRLWELNGTTYTLAAGPFTWNFSPGLHGWRTYTLPSPVAVEANHTYIISISNSADRYFVISNNFSPSQHGAYLRYQRGVYTPTLGTVPKSTVNSCYFRDVVFAISGADTLSAGTIGTSQTICYNSTPAALTELTAPIGGTGSYTYQWQISSDSTVWTDIPGATLSDYAPPALIANTYYRRGVMSGNLEAVYSDPVLITIISQDSQNQLFDNIVLDNSKILTKQILPNSGITIKGVGGSTLINTDKGTLQLSASVMPDNVPTQNVVWSVRDGSGQATIKSSGLLSAVANGSVTVMAIAKDGSDAFGTLEITITGQIIRVESIVVSTDDVSISDIYDKKGTLQLKAKIIPQNASNQIIHWSLENHSGNATIDDNGLLTAKSKGTVKVIAAAQDGSNVTGFCMVTISDPLVPTNLDAWNNQPIRIYQLFDKLYIESNDNLIADNDCFIYSISGALMKTDKVLQNPTIVDISSLPDGIYIISFKGNQFIAPLKFVIQR